MKRLSSELTDQQWSYIEPCLPPLKRGKGGPKPIDNRACFEGILWGYDRVRDGKIYQPATLLQAPVGVDYSIGKAKALGLKLGANCFEYSTAGHCSTGKRCLLMAALLLQKKGA